MADMVCCAVALQHVLGMLPLVLVKGWPVARVALRLLLLLRGGALWAPQTVAAAVKAVARVGLRL
jgi:hypothetical protein